MAKKKTKEVATKDTRKTSYRYTTEMIESALKETGGLFSHAARQLNCTPSAISQRVKNSKRLQKAVQRIKVENVDFATSQLMSLIAEKHPSSIMFYLKCQGGWQERAIITHEGNLEAGVMVVPGRLGSKQWNSMAKIQQEQLKSLPLPGEEAHGEEET